MPIERLRSKSQEPPINKMTFSKVDIVLPNEIKEYYANTPEEKQAELHADFKHAINAAKIHFEKVRTLSKVVLCISVSAGTIIPFSYTSFITLKIIIIFYRTWVSYEYYPVTLQRLDGQQCFKKCTFEIFLNGLILGNELKKQPDISKLQGIHCIIERDIVC